MSSQRSRRQIQARLRAALIAELDKMDLPSDGKHLSRVFRALTHMAVDLMKTVGIPDPITAQLLHRVAKKTLRNPTTVAVNGLFGPVPEGKA